jgi:hypothetical protein
MIKKIGLILLVFFVLCLSLYLFPWKSKVDTTIQGVQCRIGDEKYIKKVSVKIKGTYSNFLIKNDTFRGTISISDYDFTSDGSDVSLQFYNGSAFLVYNKISDGKPDMNPFGILYCTPDFKQLLICVSEPVEKDSGSWSAEKGLFISAPAETRSQALETARQLSSESETLKSILWQ